MAATNPGLPTQDAASLGLCPQRLERLQLWLDRQVSSQRLAGASVLLGRHGCEAYFGTAGFADQEQQQPFARDTIVRIFSMSKPVTTVAAMMLYEQGAFQLDDPIAVYLPEFAATRVWAGGSITNTQSMSMPITVRQLMTHTSGLTYGFMQANPVDQAYREQGIEFPGSSGTLAEVVARLASIPLLCQPGSQWNYSVSTDVLGRLVEVWAGCSLDQYFREHILDPLGMTATGFQVKPEHHDRLAALYGPASGVDMSSVGRVSVNHTSPRQGGLKLQETPAKSRYLQPTQLYSGGGGLTGSIDDYAKFCQMLLNRGEFNGQRLLSRKTVEYMRLNHLPNNADMAAMGQPVWSETSYDGIGFGLGFAVVIDPVTAQIITSPGEHHWGGAASTFFWIDPQEELFAVFFTQLIPSSTYPIRRELRTRVYQTLIN